MALTDLQEDPDDCDIRCVHDSLHECDVRGVKRPSGAQEGIKTVCSFRTVLSFFFKPGSCGRYNTVIPDQDQNFRINNTVHSDFSNKLQFTNAENYRPQFRYRYLLDSPEAFHCS
jgi:hypothetical protein